MCRSFIPTFLGGHKWIVIYRNFLNKWQYCPNCNLFARTNEHGYGGADRIFSSYKELLDDAKAAYAKDRKKET